MYVTISFLFHTTEIPKISRFEQNVRIFEALSNIRVFRKKICVGIESKVRLPLINKYLKVLTILYIFYLQPETHVLLFGPGNDLVAGAYANICQGGGWKLHFFYLPSKGRTRLNTLNTPLQEPFILHIRWGGVGGGLSPYSPPVYAPVFCKPDSSVWNKYKDHQNILFRENKNNMLQRTRL